jgi:DUF4097 and DUF4098 domain-containing protein YvlB
VDKELQEMTEQTEKTFSTPDGCDLVVKNVQGTISVEGWDRPETRVTAVRHQDWVEVEISQDGRQVVAKTKDERDPMGVINWLGKGRTPSVDYTVRVPFSSNLRLRNVSGPMQVAQIRGKVRTSNVDGPTTLESITGQVTSETVNGPIRAAELTGEAKLKAVNGRLIVERGRLAELSAEAVNGQIEVTTALSAEGVYSFNTVNGSCRLAIPGDSRARVSVRGVNSGVDCDLPTRGVERSFGRWKGLIGDGDGPMADITLRTVNGRLRIQGAEATVEEPESVVVKAEAEPPPPPPAPPEPVEPVEVKVTASEAGEPVQAKEPSSKTEVLEMIERGELSVEEALELLKELD